MAGSARNAWRRSWPCRSDFRRRRSFCGSTAPPAPTGAASPPTTARSPPSGCPREAGEASACVRRRTRVLAPTVAAGPVQDDLVLGDLERHPAGDPVDRALELLVGERDDLAALVA